MSGEQMEFEALDPEFQAAMWAVIHTPPLFLSEPVPALALERQGETRPAVPGTGRSQQACPGNPDAGLWRCYC